MSDETQGYDLAVIRQLLLAAFTPEDLRRFCDDRPTFRPVVNRFGPGYGHDDMVDELITYSEIYLVLPELLAELKQHNPRQYARFLKPDQALDGSAPATPKIFTIGSPISLILVRVPAGEFQMGSVTARDKYATDRELPPHPVHLAEFDIGRYPVTNRQYRAFVRATGHRTPEHWEGRRIPCDKLNHPVVSVAWEDAVAFCEWLSRETGRDFRLPTEAEWEKAARGTDGRIYPWGNDPPGEGLCNFNRNVKDTTTIGRYSPQGDSPYGCADMVGNVWEWCQSLYEPYPYQAGDGREDLQAGGPRVFRGGSWIHSAAVVRCAFRYGRFSDFAFLNLGFRVASWPLG